MLPTEVAWLAGLFEGEGSFYLNRIKKKGKIYIYPAAAIKMTDEDIIRRAKELFKLGTIREYNSKNTTYKKAWVYTINGYESVNALYKLLSPYLGARRLRTGREILGSTPSSLATSMDL
jgi:intein/homing endonuclease